MKKVYCKKDYLDKINKRYFYVCKTYYTHDDYIYPNIMSPEKIFVFTHLKKDKIPESIGSEALKK